MKKLLIIPFIFLIGCGDYPTMSEAEAKAYASCLEKGWTPHFIVNSSYRELSCNKKRKG